MFKTFALVVLLLASLACGNIFAYNTTPTPTAAILPNSAGDAYGKLPISFEQNEGQSDPQVQFLARGSGYSLFLTKQEMVLALKKGTSTTQPAAGMPTPGVFANEAAPNANKAATGNAVVRMRWLESNHDPQVKGADLQTGKTNYFTGNDPAGWQTNLSNYGRVEYSEIYQGVDLVFYGQGQQLEYDFVVNPGGNPANIRLSFEGVSGLEVDAQGRLVLHTPGGDLVQPKPSIYQPGAGEQERQPINGGYKLETAPGEGNLPIVSFEIAAYDPGLPLVIDPVLHYSTFLGGESGDSGSGIAVDSSGNAYVVGTTGPENFPITPGAYQTTNTGAGDVFVTKFNPTGTALVYSTYLGGSDSDSGSGIALDGSGNAYITGYTQSTNFPTAHPIQASFGGVKDAFVTKLNSTGTALLYSTYLGGCNTDNAADIAVDGSGNAYITGQTSSPDFPTSNAFQASFGGKEAAFVAKLNTGGTALVYSTYLGGSDFEGGVGIAADSSGNAYVTGFTQSPNFPTTANAFQTFYGKVLDGFVTKFNSNGSALLYSTYLGGSSEDASYAIAVDGSGNAYVTGRTSSTDFPKTANAFQTSLKGMWDGFVTKLNTTGTALVYSTYLGGSERDVSYAIAVDGSGSAYVTGSTFSTDFPTANAFQKSYAGNEDTFVTKINFSCHYLVYSTFLGGGGMDVGYGIAVDSSGNAYITGETGSGDFPTVNAFQHSYAGTNDAFVAKIGLDTPQVSLASSVNPSKAGQKVTFTVTVSGSSGTPTGQITYLVDGSSVGSYSLNSNGQAAYAISSLSAGQHTIQASYSGDFNYNQGNQASLVQKVIAPEQLPPADLVGQLRLTPDRVAANNAENLISFAFTVKNVGQGRATSVTVQLPIDPQLVIGYTEFNNPSVWVSAVNTDSVIVSLPPLANNDIINGTLIFRPNPDTVPVPGSIFSTRYTLTWTNPAGDTRQKLSNGAAFTFGVAGSNLDVSGGLVQLMSADAPNGTKITYRSNFWIGDEIVTAWLTRPDNTSVELAQGLASPQGEFAVEVDSNGLAPGTYVVAAYGQRSQVYGSGLLVVNDSGSSQAGSATMTWLKGLGQSEIIKDLTNPNK